MPHKGEAKTGVHVIPFFFKQWGSVNKKRAGKLLQGKMWDQMPAHLETMHA
jgi:protein gp37